MEIPDLEIRKEWKSSHFYIRLSTILHIFPINNFSQFLKKCYCSQGGKNWTKKSCCGGFSAYGRLPPCCLAIVGGLYYTIPFLWCLHTCGIALRFLRLSQRCVFTDFSTPPSIPCRISSR